MNFSHKANLDLSVRNNNQRAVQVVPLKASFYDPILLDDINFTPCSMHNLTAAHIYHLCFNQTPEKLFSEYFPSSPPPKIGLAVEQAMVAIL